MSYPHFFLLLAIPILQLFSCFSRFTPIWRAIFMFSAAFPALIRLSSSLNAISSTQCRLFSIPQCVLSLFPYFCGCHSFPAVYGVIYSCYGIPFFRYCRYVSIPARTAVTAIMIISRNLCLWLYGALGSGISRIQSISKISFFSFSIIIISFQSLEIIIHECVKIVFD